MALKKAKNFRGIPLAEAHYDVVGIKLDLVTPIDPETQEELDPVWRVVAKVAMYSDASKIDTLEKPIREYTVGDIENTSLISFNKVMDLVRLHEEFIDTVEA